MLTNIYDNLRNVKPGRTDWRVKVRVIREWRGVGTTGEVFKSYNLLLLDAQNCRMQAYVPNAQTARMSKAVQLGKIYLLKDFQVKKLKEVDKFRAVEIDRQIVITTDTKIKEVDESEIFIPNNMFDFFPFDDLEKMATQCYQLIDVVGIMTKKEKCYEKKNKNGKVQTQMKFKLTDGKNKINVTFWDSFAEQFEKALTDELEEPIILIIASGRISTWNEQVDVCNYSPTKVYLNYDHHSVYKMRKMVRAPDFDKGNFTARKKTFKQCTVEEIKNLGLEFIQDEIICKISINDVETKNWKVCICTLCYNLTEMEDGNNICKNCPRIVPHPIKKFMLSTFASDQTGGIKITMLDREVRTILGKNVFQIENKDDSFPTIIKTIQAKEYTVKLLITEDNVKQRTEVYQATDIFQGFEMDEEILKIESNVKQSSNSTAQPSGSSYHLDNISQLNYEVN